MEPGDKPPDGGNDGDEEGTECNRACVEQEGTSNGIENVVLGHFVNGEVGLLGLVFGKVPHGDGRGDDHNGEAVGKGRCPKEHE